MSDFVVNRMVDSQSVETWTYVTLNGQARTYWNHCATGLRTTHFRVRFRTKRGALTALTVGIPSRVSVDVMCSSSDPERRQNGSPLSSRQVLEILNAMFKRTNGLRFLRWGQETDCWTGAIISGDQDSVAVDGQNSSKVRYGTSGVGGRVTSWPAVAYKCTV